MNKIVAGFVSSLALVLGGIVVTAAPAQAATVVKFTNQTRHNIVTSNGTIRPGHTQTGFNRNSDWWKTGSHATKVKGLGVNGGVQTRCLPASNTRYSIANVSDGAADNVVAQDC